MEALVRKYGAWVAHDPIVSQLVFQAEQASADHEEDSAEAFLAELVRQINQGVQG